MTAESQARASMDRVMWAYQARQDRTSLWSKDRIVPSVLASQIRQLLVKEASPLVGSPTG
jgi:hypothetical protein